MSQFSAVNDYQTPEQNEATRSPLETRTPAAPEAAGTEFNFVQSVKDSYELDSTQAAVGRLREQSGFEYDPSFRLDEDTVEGFIEDVPAGVQPLLLDNLSNATSADHAEYIKRQTLEEVTTQTRLSEQGWGGLAVRIGVNLLDPGALALTLAAGPLGATVRATRISRAIRTGIIAGAENAALEAGLYGSSMTRRPEDIMYASLYGAALGGGLGAVIGGKGGKLQGEEGSPAHRTNAHAASTAGDQLTKLDEALVRTTAGEPVRPPTGTAAELITDAEEELNDVLSMLAKERENDLRLQTGEGADPIKTKGVVTPSETLTLRETDINLRRKALEDEAAAIPLPVVERVGSSVRVMELALEKFDKAVAEATGSPAAIRMEVDKAKREFLESVRNEDPGDFVEGIKQEFVGVNPKLEEFRDFFKNRLPRLMAKLEKQSARDSSVAEARINEIDMELKALRSEVENVRTVAKSFPEGSKRPTLAIKRDSSKFKSIPAKTLKEYGDEDASPWITSEGEWVGTGQDHLSLADANGFDDYGTFARNTGAVRASVVINPQDGTRSVFAQVYDGQPLTQQQVDSISDLLDDGKGKLAIGRSKSDGSEDFTNPKYEEAELSDLQALVTDGNRSVGAAEAGTTGADLSRITPEQDDFLNNQPRQALTGWQWNISAQTARSPNRYIQWGGNMSFENAVGNIGHDTAHAAVSEIATMFKEVADTTFMKAAKEAHPLWMKEQGLSWMEAMKPSNESRYMEAIGRAQRSGTGSPAELQAAKGLEDAFDTILTRAKEGGIPWAQKIDNSNGYLPRIAKNEVISRWSRDAAYKKGPDGADSVPEELIRRGLKSANPDMDNGLALRIAKKYIEGARRRSVGQGGQMMDLGNTDPEQLRAMLVDMEVDPDDVADVMRMLERNSERPTDVSPRGRSRLLMDMDVELEAAGGEVYRLADMFDENARTLLTGYSNSVGGLAAYAKRTKGTPFHITSRSDFEDYLSAARIEEESGGVNRNAGVVSKAVKAATFQARNLDDELDILELGWKSNLGIPISDPNSRVTIGARVLGKYNFAADMGMVVSAQVGETGGQISSGGFRNLLKQMPGLKDMLGNMRSGKVSGHLGAVMEKELALGTGRIRNGFDAVAEDASGGLGGTQSAAEQVLNRAGDVTSYAMARVMESQTRSVVTSLMQDFADISVTGAGRLTIKRMKGLGIDKLMMKRIATEMNRNAVSAEGKMVKGATLNDPNFAKWDDLDARDALLLAVRRKARKAIQENDIGQLHQAQLHSPMVRLATQFRTFVMAAMPKQLLYNIHMRDIEAANYLLWSTLMAGVGNAARISIIHQGKEDADKRMREAFDPVAFGKTTLARTAYMSVLPGLLDTMYEGLTGDPLLGEYRSTGLSATPITGNPSFRRLGSAWNLASGLARSALDSDYRLSMQDWRNFRNVLPFATLPPMSNGINALGLALDLPDKSESRF